MKKYLFAFALAVLTLAGCKKDDSADQQFEGSQWITEEIESVSMYPRHQILMDVGFTKPGVAYYAVVICEDDSNYKEGDIVKTLEKSYSYDPSTGLLSIGPDELKISFVNNDMIKAERNPEDITIFSRATKRYNLKNAIDPVGPSGPSEPEELEIWPETESEWAGGSVQINANRDDVTWSCEVLGHPVDGAPMPVGSQSSISKDGVLTLAMYKQAVTNPTPVSPVVVVTAETSDGQTATCEVTSMAWAANFYECADGASSCLYQFNVFNYASWCSASYFYSDRLMCVKIVDPTDENSAVTDDDFLSKVNIESVEMNNAGISPRGPEGNGFQFLVDASSTAGGNFKVKVTYGAFTYTVGPIDVVVL